MKKTINFRTLGAIAILASPLAANAATDKHAIEACSDAIAENIGSEQGHGVAVTIDNSGPRSKRRLMGITMFHLDAFDTKTMKVVARVECFVDRHAQVTSMRTLPLMADSATRRSRL